MARAVHSSISIFLFSSASRNLGASPKISKLEKQNISLWTAWASRNSSSGNPPPQLVKMALGAGVLNGSFATPTRFMTRWKWENVWALWAVLAMFVLPWIVALAAVPHLFATYEGRTACAATCDRVRDRLWNRRHLVRVVS